MVRQTDDFFSNDYFAAREKFLTASRSADLAITSYPHPLAGPKGGTLSTDTALLGNPKAENLLIMISGTHGLEGLAGSGIQTGIINMLGDSLPGNMAVLFVHMLNPWGAAFGRRQNEDNIDLNRNFIDYGAPLLGNLAYEKLHPLISVPDLFWAGERNPRVDEKIGHFISDFGERTFHTALFGGQYQFPDGVGFGGQAVSWSNQTLHKVLEPFHATAKKVVAIDIHSGLGPFGEGLLLSCDDVASEEIKIAKQWLGQDIIAVKEDQNLPYEIAGDVLSAISAAYPQASTISVALEYGTYAVEQLMQLQIEDAWLQRFGDADSDTGKAIRDKLRRFFYPSENQWREKVYERGEQVFGRAIKYLSQ